MLGVICGALHIADKSIGECFTEFQSSLERGQIQASNTLTNVVDVELINEGLVFCIIISLVYFFI